MGPVVPRWKRLLERWPPTQPIQKKAWRHLKKSVPRITQAIRQSSSSPAHIIAPGDIDSADLALAPHNLRRTLMSVDIDSGGHVRP